MEKKTAKDFIYFTKSKKHFIGINPLKKPFRADYITFIFLKVKGILRLLTAENTLFLIDFEVSWSLLFSIRTVYVWRFKHKINRIKMRPF